MENYFEKYRIISLFWIFIIFSKLKIYTQLETSNLLSPTSFTLSDNSIVIISSNGIHFYDENFSTEDEDKKIPFPDYCQINLAKVLMAEFSEEDGGYILIVVNNIVYFFDNEKNNITSIQISDSDIVNSVTINLIPYKKIDNILYFIFPYVNYNCYVYLAIYKFNIASNELELQEKKSYQISYEGQYFQYYGLSCIYMSPLESFNINNNLLTCFSSTKFNNQGIIFSFSFNLDDNFSEVENLRAFQISTDITYEIMCLYASSNRNKDKALIYIIFAAYPFWTSFDFTNNFTDVVRESLGNRPTLTYGIYQHKIFYFTQTNEFVIASHFSGADSSDSLCNKFVMVFHDNCQINYKGTLYFKEELCYNSNSFALFYMVNNYTILTDGGSSVSFYKSVEEIIQDISDDTQNEETEIYTTIITTFIENPTTIITTYVEPFIPTTITTTYIDNPTTIITTIIQNPTTIITTDIRNPTTIIQNPTTIITTNIQNPTTIIQNPTTIITTIIQNPTTIITTNIESIYTTILTTYFENPATISTTYYEKIPTTIVTTYNQIKENYLEDIKCKTSTPESAIYKLCITCNIDEQYYPASFPESDFLHGFTECYNADSKPINFYLDSSDNIYKPCYETCLTCSEGGNGENHNCLTCEVNFRKKPDNPNTKNCVTECYYSYYYSSYGQYKCTNNSNCPDEAHLYIKELRKCTGDCKNEDKYRFQYGGSCLENCPNGTSPNNDNICIDENVDSCTKSDSEINLQEFLSSGGVDINAKSYAKEFGYTTKHISHYYNNIYSILLYKDINCIDELSFTMPKIDFGECYNKIKEKLEPPTEDKIIIAIIERTNGQKKSTNSFFFYHPVTGEKIDADKICNEEEVIVKESMMSQLNNSEVNLNSILFLTQQDINIFNKSDGFYTDICYNFLSPNGKDVPLKDRIKTYYPNITLCDFGCTCKGVNLTSMESICECKFKNLVNNEAIEGNALIQNTLGEVTDLLNSSNLLVLKCYKNTFKMRNILKGTGGFIILLILLFEIIFGLIFILYDMSIIRKYLYNLTEYFMSYINNLNKNKINSNIENKKINPPKKGSTKVIKT